MDSAPFFVDRAKAGRASCKGCKGNCPSGELRIAKVVASPYGENQTMKSWHHVNCFLNALLKQRPATKRVESVDDIGNWENISKEDQEILIQKLNENERLYAEKNSGKYIAKVLKNEPSSRNLSSASSSHSGSSKNTTESEVVDNKFSKFHNLCKKISNVDAYTEKTAIVNNFFTKGSDGESFKGNLALWCKLLLPQVSKRVYNLKSKQLVKLFSKIFRMDHDDMLTHLEQGDIADTIQHFFCQSNYVQPAIESILTIHKVEEFLEELSKLTKEEEQIHCFKKIVKLCTQDDLKMIIRLIKGDLRINAGPKHILEGIHPDAYSAFQTTRDLNMVLERILILDIDNKLFTKKSVNATVSLMTPVLPMLAEACKSVNMAMKKCPNGMFSEIKYDGERVQVHKKGNEFKYFSRALKPVMPHKVSHFKDYLPQAFPKGVDMILDAEVLMVDVNTGKPLPFGTLGIHKQSQFKDAGVCLYIFDCLYYNGQVLLDVPIWKRRDILHEHMIEVTNHVMFSEQQVIKQPADLAKMIAEVLQLGLEGLVLKDLNSTYEPGKRHWLKVKKDYLFDGAMADTADLVVLGAWFGTGRKGGMMSVFLMGCHDKRRNKWLTVTKVHTGHDDMTLERLQKELAPLMLKISQDYNKIPLWLECNKGMVPDFIALDPKKQPVWEITGTELTRANQHTADGISVRFPRVTRIRYDKDWKTATNLEELKHLYKTSKEKTDVSLLNQLAANVSEDKSPSKIKKQKSPKVAKVDNSINKKESKANAKGKLDSFVIKEEPKNIKQEESHSNDNPSTNQSKDATTSKTNIEIDEMKLHESDNSLEKSDTDLNTSNTSNDSDGARKELKKSKLKDTDSSPEQLNDSSNSSNKDSNKIGKELKKKKLSKHDFNNDKSPKKYSEKRKRKVSDSSLETSEDSKNSFNNDSPKKRKLEANSSIEESVKKTNKKLKNRKNQKKYSTDERDSSADTISYEIGDGPNNPENPLPEVFTNKRLGFYPDFISFSEFDRDHFERHWIAYGGIVDKSIKRLDVDYVVHTHNTIGFKKMQKLMKKTAPGARHVNKCWLIKCINYKKLFDTKEFAVVLNP